MAKRTTKARDLNQLAHRLVDEATNPNPESEPSETEAQLNGRRGGRKGGTARAAKLTPKRRSEIAKKAAAARWGNR